jgi:transcriptional regulator with XRE-family HTH domain
MSYQELIARALKGRSTNSFAKLCGIPQPSMDRYVKGTNLPTFDMALKLSEESGIDPAETLKTLAEEEKRQKAERERQKPSFLRRSK